MKRILYIEGCRKFFIMLARPLASPPKPDRPSHETDRPSPRLTMELSLAQPPETGIDPRKRSSDRCLEHRNRISRKPPVDHLHGMNPVPKIADEEIEKCCENKKQHGNDR